MDANKDANRPGLRILTSVLKNTEVPVFSISEHYINGTLQELWGVKSSAMTLASKQRALPV